MGEKVEGATERENKGQGHQVLNSHFCCELSDHFSIFRYKVSTVCSLQAQNPVWGQWCEKVFRKVDNPHGTSPRMGNR